MGKTYYVVAPLRQFNGPRPVTDGVCAHCGEAGPVRRPLFPLSTDTALTLVCADALRCVRQFSHRELRAAAQRRMAK